MPPKRRKNQAKPDLTNEITEIESQIAIQKREEKKLINEIKVFEDKYAVDKEKLKLLQRLTSHRLNGLTVLSKTDDKIEIRLDPNYEGRYDDQFVLELQKLDERWILARHNLPHFTTLAQIFRNQTSDDPKQIVDKCQEYINAYVCRKGQAMKAMINFPQLRIEWTAMYDFISIYFGPMRTMKGVKVTLKYDIYDELPQETNFTVKGPQPSPDKINAIKQQVSLFDRKSIPNVLKIVMSE